MNSEKMAKRETVKPASQQWMNRCFSGKEKDAHVYFIKMCNKKLTMSVKCTSLTQELERVPVCKTLYSCIVLLNFIVS